MVQQETPGASSDVPKRPRHFFRDIGKKQILYIVLPLLLVNAGVAHLLVKQVAIRASAHNEVKDVSTSISDVGSVTDDQTPEDNIPQEPVITTYVVKSGDTLSGIADKFNISINTIRWANDLTSKSAIKPGDELVILPVSGIEYTVKKGDTLSGIAIKFDADQEDILKYNDVEANAIKVGTELIIPGAEPIVVKTPVKKPTPVATPTQSKTGQVAISKDTDKTPKSGDAQSTSSEYTVPVHGILTQGIHDRNAVDFGVSVGTPVMSFKSGTVIVAKSSGYNGGYGNYIVVNHEGSCQTQYSHLSKVQVSVGDKVSMGETIGLSGNTGRSTGPHLHFNVSNCGGNPFFKYKVGTKF